MKKLFTAREWLFIVVVCLFSFIVLLIGLRGDSPFAFESDEWDYGPHAAWMLKCNLLNPEWFVNPASTIFYPLLAYYAILRGTIFPHLFVQDGDETRMVFEHMTMLILVPRFVDLLLTVATLPLIYLVGRKWLGKGPAVVATIIFAVCPEVIRWGQTLRTDALTDFFIVLGMLIVTCAAAEPEKRSHAIWAASVTALSTSTRYFGLALLAPFVMNYLLSFWQSKRLEPLINLITFALLLPILFFCFSPFVILDYQQTITDLKFEAFSDLPGVSGYGLFSNSNYYATEVMPFCLGWILTFAVPIGLALVLIKKPSRLTASFITMLIGFWLGTCFNSRHWYRWLLPMVPGFAMLAGYALFVLFQILDRLLGLVIRPAIAKKISVALVSIVLLIALKVPLLNDYQLEIDKVHYTGSAQIWMYIRDHIPPRTKIAIDVNWNWTGKWLYDLKENACQSDPAKFLSPSELARQGYQYLICSVWNRSFYEGESTKYPVESRFYSEVVKQCPLLYATKENTVKIFDCNPYNRCTVFEIYDLRPLLRRSQSPARQVQ